MKSDDLSCEQEEFLIPFSVSETRYACQKNLGISWLFKESYAFRRIMIREIFLEKSKSVSNLMTNCFRAFCFISLFFVNNLRKCME